MTRRADRSSAVRAARLAMAVAAVILAGCTGPAPNVSTPAASLGSPTSTAAGATAPPGWLAAVCETLQPLQDAERLLAELASQGLDDPQRRAILAEGIVDAILEAELEADLIPTWPDGERIRGGLERMTAALAAVVPSLDAGPRTPDPEPLASATRQLQVALTELRSIREDVARLASPIPPQCLGS